MRSIAEGVLPAPENPSTALRAVPLPGECRGGFVSLRHIAIFTIFARGGAAASVAA
jgi:hypothetical protein